MAKQEAMNLIPQHRRVWEEMELEEIPELVGLHFNPQELLFVYEYMLNGFNEKDAWEAVVGSEVRKNTKRTTFYMQARNILGRDNVQQAIKKLLSKQAGKYRDTLETQLVEQLVTVATYDVSDVINERGELIKPFIEMPVGLRTSAIEGIETKHYGRDGDVEQIVVKLANKAKARDQLIQILKLWKDLEVDSKEMGKVFNIFTDIKNIDGHESFDSLFRKSLDMARDVTKES